LKHRRRTKWRNRGAFWQWGGKMMNLKEENDGFRLWKMVWARDKGVLERRKW